MRIVYVLPHGWRFARWSVPDVLERYHFSKHLASVLTRLGHEVTLILLHESMREHEVVQTEPFRIEILPVTLTLPFVRFGADLSLPLFRKIRSIQADALHIHGCFYEGLPWLLRESRVPTVLQWHGGRIPSLHRRLFREAYRKARRILIPFAAVRQLFQGVVPDPEMFEVVPLPLRPEARAVSPKARSRHGTLRLLYVGRIPRPGRGLLDRRLDLFLRILGRMRDTPFSFDVVGEGPGRALCERIAQRERIQAAVTFHGYMALPDLLPLYAASDLTIVPFSLPDLTGTWVAQIQESLAAGTPVVAFSPNGRYSEHEIGWRISAHPVDGVAQLKTILSGPERVETKGRTGALLVQSRCDEHSVGQLLESVYQTL